ncbi:MAG TPA: PAS-domain containing protein [Xanthobacteraceae bacterium]|jgi:signal transduction histidine kinase
MPETIRATGGSPNARRRTYRFRTAAAGALFAAPSAAVAQSAGQGGEAGSWPFNSPYIAAFARLQQHEIAALALIVGVVFFAVFTAILLVRTRAGAAANATAAREKVAALKTQLDQLTGLLLSEPQVLVSWPAAIDEPQILGDALAITGNADPAQVLAFGAWLAAGDAQAMTQAVERLRAEGESFSCSLITLAGRQLEAEGRAIAGRAVMKLRDVSGVERKLSEVKAARAALESEAAALRSLIEALPSPAWLRDKSGKLSYVNAAYARAVEAADGARAAAQGIELIDRAGRADLALAAAAGGNTRLRLPAIMAGKCLGLDVIEVPTTLGRAGIGLDASEVDGLRREVGRLAEAHRRTLDQLATAVATFGVDQRLAFYNAAYLTLWDLDATFLDQRPTDSELLDRLRNEHKLPDQRDFKQWKKELHGAYQANEAQAHVWHLADGRTLRVIATPQEEGGVTYLFNDVTERLDLERRFDALIHVQGETLDNLAEALAVFGSDGRVRLFNPAFTRMWRIDAAVLREHPHIETVIALCRPLHNDDATWQQLRTAVTALDRRDPVALRIERADHTVADCSTVPLPDGGTLIAFQDVTASVSVERALREGNEALLAADRLKVKFVRHVSYELRSPLTNIVGFAEMLRESGTGPLNERQSEYVGHITGSTNALLALIDDILDLATIDAGAMNLDLGAVDIHKTMAAAAEGLQDRLAKDDIKLDIRAVADIGSFTADERRVRQALFNLLSNAVGFSPPGSTVTLTAERTDGSIVFAVTDRGTGIPPDMLDKVFDWFETNTIGSRHRGAGLGLSLVRSFVELHGGRVDIDSAVGRGTTVICTFPLGHAVQRSAA